MENKLLDSSFLDSLPLIDGKVYFLDKKYVIKSRNSISTEYEYVVGQYLNTLESNCFVHTYGKYNDIHILFERVRGITWTKWIEEGASFEQSLELAHDVLKELEQFKLTHYDLHTDNVIVELDKNEEYIGNFKIIDYASMYIPPEHRQAINYSPTNYKQIEYGMIPSVYDPYFDTHVLLGSLLTSYEDSISDDARNIILEILSKNNCSLDKYVGYEDFLKPLVRRYYELNKVIKKLYLDYSPLAVVDRKINGSSCRDELISLLQMSPTQPDNYYNLLYEYKLYRVEEKAKHNSSIDTLFNDIL